ncbi:hypothetical protein QYZ87_08930 [Porphyromonadaceae bacterium W3.11]|nr:hypothetical protein [Porphyromonadaceae bacterium W3.11]
MISKYSPDEASETGSDIIVSVGYGSRRTIPDTYDIVNGSPYSGSILSHYIVSRYERTL